MVVLCCFENALKMLWCGVGVALVVVLGRGCHLMTHDDVIGTRRVSYIIYFSEPTPKWEIKDGGLLELYPLAKGEATQDHHSVLSGVPAVTPTACLCPACALPPRTI